jgi:hypothetical protein
MKSGALSRAEGENAGTYEKLEWLYESADGAGYRSSIAPKNAGVYKLTISVPDSDANYEGSETFTFTIKKRRFNGISSSSKLVTHINNGASVSGKNLDLLISGGENLMVDGDKGAKLVFDTDALRSIDQQTSGEIKIKIKDVSEDYLDTHKGKRVFSMTVTSGSYMISNIVGKVVFLPYELKEGEDAKDVTVWYLEGDGTMTEIPCTYDPESKLATFEITHFSLYVVGAAGKKPWINPFSDVAESDWFYGAVKFANQNELYAGTSTSIEALPLI